jgi:hypothetical protein
MSRVTYPPLDTLKQVAEGLWLVDSGPMSAMGIPLPVRMTVIRLPNGQIMLHPPTRWSDALNAELSKLGVIGHLVAPSVAHWTFMQEWQARHPDAVTWASPGLRKRGAVKKSGLRIDEDLGELAPAIWSDVLKQRVPTGGFGVTEVIFQHLPTRTAILVDLVQNFEPDRIAPLVRPLARMVGVVGPNGRAPVYYRFAINRNRAAAQAVARELVEQWRPERVLFAHGRWFETNGTARLQKSLDWLLD